MEIHTYEIRPKIIQVPTDSFEFVPTGKFRWFKKALWRFLHWSGCLNQYIENTETYQKIYIDEKDFSKKVFEVYTSYVGLTSKIPKHVYMGPEDFYQLTYQEPGLNEVKTFVQFHKDRWTVFNIPVTVVPYMEGILFV